MDLLANRFDTRVPEHLSKEEKKHFAMTIQTPIRVCSLVLTLTLSLSLSLSSLSHHSHSHSLLVLYVAVFRGMH
jgi:ABC-type arginine transport system permease subunit